MNLSSLLTSLVIPLNLFAALLLLAVILFVTRHRKTAAALALSGLLWAGAWSLPATSLWVGGYLENMYPYQSAAQAPRADAIVVLGGYTAQNRSNWFLPSTASRTSARVERAADLYKAERAPYIVLSGAALDGGVSEAQIMAHTLSDLDVPAWATLMENNSLTTQQNGEYTARLLDEKGFKRVLLVTSALHMPRAVAIFRKQGVDVIPAGAAPQITVPDTPEFSRWRPSLLALQSSRSIIKEYVGILVYWSRGWT
ncbi:YdcF family protein [Alcaligenes sp. SDU_A2]|uniref:YdcF family protein n=1 Tax=Alcaligenes sp. SDU_A2 TaxID=3136634 RepID=UPI00311F9DE7